MEEVAVVRDDEDGLSSERQLQDAVVLVVGAVGDGLVGFEHSATGRLSDHDKDAEVLLDGLRVPLEASVGFRGFEHPFDVGEHMRAEPQAELDRIVGDANTVSGVVPGGWGRTRPRLERILTRDDSVDEDVDVEDDRLCRSPLGHTSARRARTRFTRSLISLGAMPRSEERLAP